VETGSGSGKCGASKEAATPPVATLPVLPEEMVLAIAAYCEQAAIPDGEVVLHFFPFGGVAKSVELIAELVGGAWPVSNST
jgi:hypothetical protein